ncbi:integral membrane sensor hybrid histidine kinase [Flammeovirgaceae bacterium 311]|nr:integral membrane sensor hybrid histidine kinase [Flammeovirgaceae bacterium 311]
MWFGTKFGLNRFDGLKFTTFTKDGNGLGFDDVQSIAQDAEGYLWLMGPYGQSHITLFDPLTNKAVSFEEKFNKKRPSTLFAVPQRLLGSPNGTIFFADYQPAVLISYHPTSGLKYVPLPQFKRLAVFHTTARNTVWAIADDKHLLELTPEGRILHQFSHPQESIIVCFGQRNAGIEFFYFLSDPASSSPQLFYSIDEYGKRREWALDLLTSLNQYIFPVGYAFDQSGLLWDGMSLRDSTGGALLTIAPQTSGESIENRSFLRDRNGLFWLGTSFGVYQVKLIENHFQRLFYQGPSKGGSGYAIRGIAVKGSQVFANLEKSGLYASSPSGGLPQKKYTNGDEFAAANALIPDGQGNLYVGIGNQLVHYNLSTGTNSTVELPSDLGAWALHALGANKLLVGSSMGLFLYHDTKQQLQPFTRYNQFTELAQAHILYIAPDRKGALWICANTGFYTVHPEKGVTARYWSGGKGHFQLPADSYHHFYQDPQGLFWLATANAGLIRWDREQNIYRQFRRTEGLSNDNIYAVYADWRGHLWLSSDYGIMQFDPVGMTARSYTVQDGITSNEFNRISHFQAKDGQLYFGSLNGITSFNPRDFEHEKPPVTLPLHIVSFRQFDDSLDKLVDKTEELATSNRIIIRPDDRTSVLDFTLLNYADASNNVYAYQFKGLDNEWTYQTEPSLRLGNLPYGDYQLLVKGQASDGRLSSANLSIQVSVLRPFYLRSWFLMLMVFLLIGSVWGWGRWRAWSHRQAQTRLKAQIKEATHVIAEQAQDLLRLDETKSRFFANISHEFRTPLTVILGMAANLKLNPDPELQQTASLIERQGSNLLRLINQILDLSRLEAGEMPFQLVRADLVSFIHYVGESYHSMAKAKGIQLLFTAERDAIEADFNPDRLQDILANLLANAIKFTPTGGQVMYSVTLQEGWHPLTAAGYHEEITPTSHLDQSWIRITVSDTGPGIEPDSLARIFDRFYQAGPPLAGPRSAENPQNTQGGGTGIGLSLVRELVVLMQGGLAVRNQYVLDGSDAEQSNLGAEFVVFLPLTRQAPLAEAPALLAANSDQPEWIQPSQEAAVERPVLLLVEDNDDVATYTQTCLRGAYQVVRAKNGQEGIDLALATIPDLILSDVMMPLKDGFVLCDTLKNDERTSHIPIVLLTARAAVIDRIAGLRRGADAYLVKPFQREELLVVLSNQLQSRRLLQHYYEKLALGNAEANSIPAESPEAIEDKFVTRLRSTLTPHLDNPSLDSDMICQLMGMSRNTLHRKVTALTGLSINPYLRALRLQKAKELLLTHELSIAEVAHAVGFEDPSYFGRVFSEAYKMSPGQFRSMHNK